MAITTRARIASYHVHLSNGDDNFQPYTHLILRLEVLDGGDNVISVSNQSALFFHKDDIQTQLDDLDKRTVAAGFTKMVKAEKDKLTDHIASIQKGQLNAA